MGGRDSAMSDGENQTEVSWVPQEQHFFLYPLSQHCDSLESGTTNQWLVNTKAAAQQFGVPAIKADFPSGN